MSFVHFLRLAWSRKVRQKGTRDSSAVIQPLWGCAVLLRGVYRRRWSSGKQLFNIHFQPTTAGWALQEKSLVSPEI